MSMILNTCPHHPTLLTILLNVCLSYNLALESHIILHALLVVSISSPDASLPPIAHAAHTSYLIELLSTWTARSDQQPVSLCTSRAFVIILTGVLADTRTPDVWTCRAIAKLARELRKKDFVSFIHLSIGLAQFISNKTNSVPAKR